jgi:cytosine/adenosine deaminase-related metal-dependent hydrolase
VKTLVTATSVLPMDRPVIRDGGVVFENGVIRKVGLAGALLKMHGDAQHVELGKAILLPGLVNAHAHLELSNARRDAAPSRDFADWLLQRIAQSKEISDERQYYGAAIAEGISQCLRFGVTTVADITTRLDLTRPLLAASPLRVISFGEVRAMSGRRMLLEPRLAAATDASHTTSRLSIGISPHAPYSIEAVGYRRCLEESCRLGIPLTTHLAESPDEAEFLARHAGPLAHLWNELGGLDAHVPTFAGGPIRFAASLELLEHPTLLAHVNYCNDDELLLLAAGQASVVYNPRTHAFFGHPPHRWRDMLAAGINVTIGTDSCASSPDLNLLQDLRLLHRLSPGFPAERLFELATLRAARALGLDHRIGSITPGKSADLIAFALDSKQPLLDLLESNALPARVWIDGEPCVVSECAR